MDGYAEAFAVERGRCFRLVDDGQGKPTGCPEAVTGSGWLQVEGRWYEVDACGRHSGEARFRGHRPLPK